MPIRQDRFEEAKESLKLELSQSLAPAAQGKVTVTVMPGKRSLTKVVIRRMLKGTDRREQGGLAQPPS